MVPGPNFRPRTVGELLDGSFFFYRKHFGRFLLLATIVSLPTLIVAGVTAEAAADVLRDAFQTSLDSIVHPKQDPIEALQEQLALNMRTQTYGLIATLLQALSRGGVIAVMAITTFAALEGRSVPGVRETLRRALPRMPAAVLAYTCQAFLGPFLLCCPPGGVVLLVLITPAPVLVMFEVGAVERGVRAMLPAGALGVLIKGVALAPAQVIDATFRSLILGWHAVTIVRGTSFVFFIGLFVSLFVGAVTGAVTAVLDSGAAWFWLNHYCEVLFLPIVGISVTLWYFDLRIRREAADLIEGEIALA